MHRKYYVLERQIPTWLSIGRKFLGKHLRFSLSTVYIPLLFTLYNESGRFETQVPGARCQVPGQIPGSRCQVYNEESMFSYLEINFT